MKFGEKVTLLRKRKGLSQAELGEQLHLSKQAVQKWESGAGMPDIAVMLPLSKILGCTVDLLLDDEKAVPLTGKAESLPNSKKIKMTFEDLKRRRIKPFVILLIVGSVLFLTGLLGLILAPDWGWKFAFSVVMFFGVSCLLLSIAPFSLVLRKYNVEGHQVVVYAGAQDHYLIVDEYVEDYLEISAAMKERYLKTTINDKELVVTITWTNNVTVKVDGQPIFPEK